MKKRKKPIFLVAVLALLVVVVVAFNASTFASSQATDQTPKTADAKPKVDTQTSTDKLSPEQQIIDKEKAEKAKAPAKGILKKDDDSDALPIHGKGHDAIAPDAPKIMAPPDFHAQKVTPDKGSVNSQGQWYSQESGVR